MLVEGIMTRLDELCAEICALRERVETLDETLAKMTMQTVVGAKQATVTAASTPNTATSAPSTKGR